MRLKRLFVVLLFLGVFACKAFAVQNRREVARSAYETIHNVNFVTITDAGYCSSTAIGHHALLTATHCELGTDNVYVDGVVEHIVGHIRDGLDHTILLLDGDAFTVFASFADDTALPGDEIFIWGNLGHLGDVYRRGTVSGAVKESLSSPVQILYDFNGYFGDSGAAVFNDKGQIVGVISMGENEKRDDVVAKFMYGFPLAFTPKQIAAALAFKPPVGSTN